MMEDIFIIQTDSFQLTQSDFLIRMLISVGIGLVIGLEREFSKGNQKEIFAGLRTLSIVAAMGFTFALLNYLIHPWLFIIGLISLCVIVSISYWITANNGEIGSTTEFATIFTYLLGGLTFLGYIELSLALTVILVVLLSLKIKFQNIVGQINHEELSAFIRFVVIALLILPFLPDKNFGPYNVVNPSEIGWIIVLTSGIGFIGYILMKFLGTNRGILLTGIFGGMVSSTVVTWPFSKKSKETPELSANYAVAIFAAASIMILRVVAWVYIFNVAMLHDLALPLVIIFGSGLAITIYFYKKQKGEKHYNGNLPLGEPLNIKDATLFGLLYTGILILVSYASTEYGSKGIYLSSAISALTDIDAISISVSKLGGTTINFLTAQNAILLATLANTIVKIGISLYSGSQQLKKYVLVGYGIIFLAGIIGFIILNY
ncbi:MgtC/SapB family protein [Winogradskyella thalassocola]|uniref:Uncharacterized membrane protein, DUF4010 family n=1 Tax=Winogradskyella thalassocola TaxID=262004 RepID=A0A1G8BCG0_9FLAO|nr:MgtC/SapB family protein [Winogradskyella thalassocola]SDH30889.1 Uncharacterized membrane protein, DUF4010 family [Winogradskyella thalassocola]